MLRPDAGSRGAASLHLALPSGARAWPRHRGVQHHRAPSSSRSNGVSIRVTGGSSGSSLATHQRHRHARLLLLRRVRKRAREAGVSSGRGRQGGRGAAAAGGRGWGQESAEQRVARGGRGGAAPVRGLLPHHGRVAPPLAPPPRQCQLRVGHLLALQHRNNSYLK